MNMLLKQARNGMKALINENSQVLSIALSADPTDPWAGTTAPTFRGRISHDKPGPDNLSKGNAGLSANLDRFLSVEYDVDFLVVGSIITDQNSKDWKLGAVDPLEKFGGIYGYQVQLEEAV